MPRRSLFQMFFGVKEQEQTPYKTQLQLLNGTQAVWTNFNSNLYDNTQIRTCIDAIARNGAKLNPKHVRYTDKGYEEVKGNVYHLIAKKPNEMMNAYDFYYKVISELYLNNNAFIYILRDANNTPIGLYPLSAGKYQLLEYKNNIYVRFFFTNSQQYTASLKDDVIHLKRFYCTKDVVGDSNLPIIQTMSFKHILDEGIINAIKTTQGIKGILKTTKAMLKPEDIKKTRDTFVNDFLNGGNGIAGLDATTDFKEVNINPQTATDGQVKIINDQILNYFGINEKILQSTFNEEEWNAFYENCLQPIALQLSLEFTNKIFTYGEIWHGNEIVFEANRLQYANTDSKIKLARYMNNYLTINEIREIFNLAPVENGDQFAIDVNHNLSDEIGNESEDDTDE